MKYQHKENNNHCKPIEVIKQLLTYTGVTVKIQDLELTPENYKNPIIPRARELTAPVMSTLYQNINAYFHIISIESDTDIVERAPQEQINHDLLSSVDGTHKNNRSGKFVNVCGFFSILKS